MSLKMECTFLHETEAAVRICDAATGEVFWIPLSQVDEMHGKQKDGTGEGSIVMSDWIARQKGLL